MHFFLVTVLFVRCGSVRSVWLCPVGMGGLCQLAVALSGGYGSAHWARFCLVGVRDPGQTENGNPYQTTRTDKKYLLSLRREKPVPVKILGRVAEG